MKKSPITLTLILFALFLAYTCACIMVDVGEFTPQSVEAGAGDNLTATDIGFHWLNLSVHNSLGFNRTFYDISEYLGYAALLTGFAIGCLWLYKLIRCKHPLKVEPCLNASVITMALMVVFYLLFELIKLNYRPVILSGGELEASYPSSHTLLGCVIFGCAAMVSGKLVQDASVAKSLKWLFYVLAIVLTLFRALSGVHWISDIIGGVLLSLALLSFGSFAMEFQNEIPEKQ